MAQYFLGVDGGQSSTTALIGDETGRVLGMGRGGACNHVSGPEAKTRFQGAMEESVGAACVAAGLPPTAQRGMAQVEFAAGCFGFSGGAADKEALIREFFRIAKLQVTNDALIALAGAHAGGPGVITIAGTGSISFARGKDGKIARSGGWGFIFGDEGGGFDLTRQALRAMLRHEEGWGPATSLRERLLAETGAKDANDLLHRCYTPEFPRPKIASFSKIVGEAADGGDAVAIGILDAAAQQLAAFTTAARNQVFGANDVAAISPIGGVFRSKRVLDRFTSILELYQNNKVAEPQYGPAAGALLMAYRGAGLSVKLSQVPTEKA